MPLYGRFSDYRSVKITLGELFYSEIRAPITLKHEMSDQSKNAICVYVLKSLAVGLISYEKTSYIFNLHVQIYEQCVISDIVFGAGVCDILSAVLCNCIV